MSDPSRVELGEVTVPSGNLFLVDCGLLPLWCHDQPPVMPDDILDPDRTADVNASADLELVGKDAVAFGETLDRSPLPQWIFDILASEVDAMVAKLTAQASAAGAEVEVRIVRPQITHLQRAKAVLEALDAGEVQFYGIRGTVVRGIPSDRPLSVSAEVHRGSEYEGRWERVRVSVSDAPVATSAAAGTVAVDEARILVTDLDAVGAWDPESAPDGLADVAFWGRDGEVLAQQENAPRMEDGTFGWQNLPMDAAVPLARRLFTLRETRDDLKFALDFRPHTVEWHLLEQVRYGGTESGTVEFGGAKATMFMTTWGDGFFDVFRDLDRDGNLVAVRIELAATGLDMMQRMRGS